MVMIIAFFFFFQAEDGIRDIGVTGVQTCALPISDQRRWLPAGAVLRGGGADRRRAAAPGAWIPSAEGCGAGKECASVHARSEERRVGKECRSRWSPYH